MDTPPPINQPAKSGGKKWIFLGCGGCLGLIVVGCLAVGGIMFTVFAAMKSSDAYKTALAGTVNSPAVQEALGTPIKESFMVTGSVNVNNDAGDAFLLIPVSGPKGAGVINYRATRSGGIWNTTEFTVTITNGGKIIDLKNAGQSAPIPPVPLPSEKPPAQPEPSPEPSPVVKPPVVKPPVVKPEEPAAKTEEAASSIRKAFEKLKDKP